MDKREYRCTRCGRGQREGVTREKLLVKKSVFVTMGNGGKTVRSRVADWLCSKCLEADSDWNKDTVKGSSFLEVPLG